MNGIELITQERERQRILWDAEHDKHEVNGELAVAAGLYALDQTYATEILNESMTESGRDELWPWTDYTDNRGNLERVRQLTIAGALIAAEIDRIQAEH